MNDQEVVAHLRAYVDSAEFWKPFAWATDGCGYEQHIRFVHWRGKHWRKTGDLKVALSPNCDRDGWREFVLAYADALERGEVPPYEEIEFKWRAKPLG